MKLRSLLMTVGLGFGLLPLGCAAAGSDSVQSEESAVTACYTNSGIDPTKAALAVAMATELGRWDPAHDLSAASGTIALSSTALCVKNSCKNTKALLGQQDTHLTSVIDQNVFSPTNYHNNLYSSLGRQASLLSDLTHNDAAHLPPAHKLTLVGGPTNLGPGACGPHYIFQADHTNGTPLSAAEAANLGNGLCFYGYGSCGNNNPYIAFTVTGQHCPSGRICVAVDPTDGDNGSGTTTTAGTSPTYPLNRLYDPANSKLNSACTTTGGVYGSMVSKCSTIPSTCNYLYCVGS